MENFTFVGKEGGWASHRQLASEAGQPPWVWTFKAAESVLTLSSQWLDEVELQDTQLVQGTG
jgi:hypothetical protein